MDLLPNIEKYKEGIKKRPWWMNNDKNLNYEFKYIENELLISRTKYEWEKWI